MIIANSQKLKVAEVITRMDWGGSPDIVRLICKHLDPNLYDIRLIVGPSVHPTQKTKDFLEEFKDKVITVNALKRNINPINDFAALGQLRETFKREKFDIVHTHTAKAGALGRLAARKAGVPIIIHTPHGHNFYGYFGFIFSKIIIAIERHLCRFTDKIICLTQLEKKDFIKFKVASQDKLALIPQGLELDEYKDATFDKDKLKKNLGLPLNEDVVGYIGRLEPIKGLDYLIAAVKLINNNVKFLIVGDGSLRERLGQKVKALGLSEKFIFTGWRSDIAQLLFLMDLLVLPSLNEAVGISLIQAQAMGVPVVASNVGGIPEIIRDNFTGILVPPANPQALAKAIAGLLNDKQKRLGMSKEAKAWIKGKFRVEDMINRISGLYQELAGKKL